MSITSRRAVHAPSITRRTEMQAYRIAVLPGDGIGPEVMDAALRVVEHVVEGTAGLGVRPTLHEAGAGLYRRTGTVLA